MKRQSSLLAVGLLVATTTVLVAAVQQTLYLEVSETRLVPMNYRSGRSDRILQITDPLGVIKAYQSQSTPSLSSGYITQNPIIPRRRILAEDYNWEGYWLNSGSSVTFSFACDVGTVVDFSVIDGDENFRDWEADIVGKPRGFASHDPRYSSQIDTRTGSITSHYTSSAQNIYFGLENRNPDTATSCNQTISIQYKYYLTNTMILRGTGSQTLYGVGGGNVVLVAPNKTDSRNVYNGPDGFNVGADMYTVYLDDDPDDGCCGNKSSSASTGVIIGSIFGALAGFILLVWCCVWLSRRGKYGGSTTTPAYVGQQQMSSYPGVSGQNLPSGMIPANQPTPNATAEMDPLKAQMAKAAAAAQMNQNSPQQPMQAQPMQAQPMYGNAGGMQPVQPQYSSQPMMAQPVYSNTGAPQQEGSYMINVGGRQVEMLGNNPMNANTTATQPQPVMYAQPAMAMTTGLPPMMNQPPPNYAEASAPPAYH